MDLLGDWDYTEGAGSGRTGVTSQNFETERIFMIKWSSFPQFIDDVLGYSFSDFTVVPAKIVRITPDAHPYIDNCFAQSAEVEGVGIKGSLAFSVPEPQQGSTSGSQAFTPAGDCLGDSFVNYSYGLVKVKYGRPSYTLLPYYDYPAPGSADMPANPYVLPPNPADYPSPQPIPTCSSVELQRYVSIRPTFSGDYMRLDNGNVFRWCSRDPQHPDFNVNDPRLDNRIKIPINRINSLTSLDYTWHEVPGQPGQPFTPPNWATIQDCLGKVNKFPFDPFNFGYVNYYDPFFNGNNFAATSPGLPGNCVLFTGVEPKLACPRLNQASRYTWDLTYKFAVRMNTPVATYLREQYGIKVAGHQYLFDPMNAWWDLISVGRDVGGGDLSGFIPSEVIPTTPADPANPDPEDDAKPQYQSTDLNRLFALTG